MSPNPNVFVLQRTFSETCTRLKTCPVIIIICFLSIKGTLINHAESYMLKTCCQFMKSYDIYYFTTGGSKLTLSWQKPAEVLHYKHL